MTDLRSSPFHWLAALAAITFAAAPAGATAPAAVEAAGSTLVVRAPALAAGAALRVTGPEGFVLDRTLPAGDTLVPLADGPLADGQYRWELRFLPAARERRATEPVAVDREGGADAAHGSFRVVEGAIVLPYAALEAEAPEDGAADAPQAPDATVLTNADGVIRNSLCVGFDCPNSPSFSDTTILLMENNTRFKFDDTSSISGFPNRDWQLLANDSASGGLNRFSIQDCGASSQGGCSGNIPFTVEAGAPANSLYVDDGGRVGFRTSTPVLALHARRGDTPGLRLEQDGSSGFAPQTWDVSGNEANFFVRDVTSGSRLPLRIRPGAPTSSLDIAASGNLGVGTASPTASVQVVRDGSGANATIGLQNTGGTNPVTWFLSNFASANGAFTVSSNFGGAAPFKLFSGAPVNSIVIGQQGGTEPRVGIHRLSGLTQPFMVGTDATNGNGAHVTAAGVWTNGSSRRHKVGIAPLSAAEALAAVAQLVPVRYRGEGSPDDEEYVGFIAEDVPALVAQNDRESLSPMDIVAVLTKVVQQQQIENARLAARLASLEARLGAPADAPPAP